MLGPALAMESTPDPSCVSWKFSSSNLLPGGQKPRTPTHSHEALIRLIQLTLRTRRSNLPFSIQHRKAEEGIKMFL